MVTWGLLPEAVRERLRKLEWDNQRNQRDRFKGLRSVPMQVNLHPPTGREALADVVHLHRYIAAWQAWPHPSQVEWQQRQFRELGELNLPSKFVLADIQSLIETIGASAIKQANHWQTVMQPLVDLDQRLYPVLIDHLPLLSQLELKDTHLLAQVLPQLHYGMGEGKYIRALPLVGVHTKVLEQHASFIAALLDVFHGGEVSEHGGLTGWLGCRENPNNWILVRALCAKTQAKLGNLSILQVDAQTLIEHGLPSERVIIVENYQSGLSLPALPNTIAVMSGGGNLGWLNNDWLPQREAIYWGDIDSWGFGFLDRARAVQPRLASVMMDDRTVATFCEHMVNEAQSNWLPLAHLTADESGVFENLRRGRYPGNRLEQEKLPQDYVTAELTRISV